MCRGPEQTFFQRRHTDGQYTHEKMLNITHHQGQMQSKTAMKYYLTLVRMAKIKKIIISVDKDVEKKESVGGNVNWHSHCGKQYKVSQKIKNSNTIRSNNSTTGYLPKEMKH